MILSREKVRVVLFHVAEVKLSIETNECLLNRPRSIYQYSSMAPRLSGQNCKFLKFLLSLNSQRRLGYKENNTKYRR